MRTTKANAVTQVTSQTITTGEKMEIKKMLSLGEDISNSTKASMKRRRRMMRIINLMMTMITKRTL